MHNPAERAFVGASPRRLPTLSFRPIVDADLPFLSALYASTRRDELAPVPWPDAAKRDFLAQQFQAQHAHYRATYTNADFFVVMREGECIGRIYVSRGASEIRIVDIALLPEHCGQGIGSTLLAELIDEARATRRDLTLHVEPHNPAQRLYARLGFQLAEHRGYYDLLKLPPS